MASATMQAETVTTATVKSVTLELTPEEARTLAAVFVRIGGSPDGSPREHTDSVLEALNDVGITHRGSPEHHLLPAVGLSHASLYFSDYPAEG